MKKSMYIRLLTMLLLLCLTVSLLYGCSVGEGISSSEEKAVNLRIVVEESLNGNMEDSLHRYLKQQQTNFSAIHKDVEIVIEQIPKGKGREKVLQRLRTELMVGEGPDILLLPTLPTDGTSILGHVEPLIPDVQVGMRNGLFLDISGYYDADSELGKEALNQDIMDAGIFGEARYVLPLCYDLPVAYVDKNAFAESNIQQDIFSCGAVELLSTVAQMENLADIGSFSQNYCIGTPLSFNFFPQLVDYETGRIDVTAEELEMYLQAWQSYRVKLSEAIKAGCSAYGSADLYGCYGSGTAENPDVYWGIDGFFAFCGSLLDGADNVLLARSHGVELDMYPMRAIDGTVVADVTFYGAISSGCEHPELAYEFLRNYLSTEFQHNTGCPDVFGWPVRTEGSVIPMCSRVGIPMLLTTEGMAIINRKDIKQEEMPILNAKIDCVRFSLPLETEFGDAVASVYDYREAKAADLDIEQLAEDWVKKLQIHVDEG